MSQKIRTGVEKPHSKSCYHPIQGSLLLSPSLVASLHERRGCEYIASRIILKVSSIRRLNRGGHPACARTHHTSSRARGGCDFGRKKPTKEKTNNQKRTTTTRYPDTVRILRRCHSRFNRRSPFRNIAHCVPVHFHPPVRLLAAFAFRRNNEYCI